MNFREITSYEIAAAIRKIDPAALPDCSAIPDFFHKPIIASFKLMVIFQAINMTEKGGDPWQPNWSDKKQYKYFPWFRVEADKDHPAGVGFSDTGCDCWYTFTDVGSRLCTFSAERSIFIGEQFQELYKDLFLIS